MEGSVLVFAGIGEVREFMWNECWAVLGDESGGLSDDDIRPACRQEFDLGPEALVSNAQLLQFRKFLCEIHLANMGLSGVKAVGEVEDAK